MPITVTSPLNSQDTITHAIIPIHALTGNAYQFTKKISGALRAGYASQNTDAGGFSGATVGGGLGYDGVRFDFAFVPFGDLGNEYQYSLTIRF